MSVCSSRLIKRDIRPLGGTDAIAVLRALRPSRYFYNMDESGDEHLGFIAEDVPDLVASKNRKDVSPMNIVAVLTKVIQDLEQQNRMQAQQIARLDDRIARLERGGGVALSSVTSTGAPWIGLSALAAAALVLVARRRRQGERRLPSCRDRPGLAA